MEGIIGCVGRLANVAPTGLDPATNSFEGCRSIQTELRGHAVLSAAMVRFEATNGRLGRLGASASIGLLSSPSKRVVAISSAAPNRAACFCSFRAALVSGWVCPAYRFMGSIPAEAKCHDRGLPDRARQAARSPQRNAAEALPVQ